MFHIIRDIRSIRDIRGQNLALIDKSYYRRVRFILESAVEIKNFTAETQRSQRDAELCLCEGINHLNFV